MRYWLQTLLMIVLPAYGWAQAMPTYKPNYFTLEASFSALNQQFDQTVYGQNIALGFRVGVAKVWTLGPNWETTAKLAYSQAGTRYIRVYPTGKLDTVNIYNSIQIYRQQERLHYLNLKFGLRKAVFKGSSTRLFLGLNTFAGYLLSARLVGKELSGDGAYNNDALSIFNKLNWGLEPEVSVRIYLADGQFFTVTGSYEVGLANLLKYSQSSAQTEYTRAYCLSVNFPFFNRQRNN